MEFKKLRLKIFFVSLSIAFFSCQYNKENVGIVTGENPSNQTVLAAEILLEYLGEMYSSNHFTIEEDQVSEKAIYLIDQEDGIPIEIKKDLQGLELSEKPESFHVKSIEMNGTSNAYIVASDARGLFYGVYELLEKLGCSFLLSEDFVPQKQENVKFDNWDFANAPLTEKRIVFNWHNFLSGCSAWDFPEYKMWIDAAQKMKYNAIMVHAYGNNPMYRFELNGEHKPSGYIPNTQRGRDWGTNHVNDIRNLYGGEIFEEAIFGSKASQAPESEVEEVAVNLMQEVFNYAESHSMDVIFAFDMNTVSSNPPNILLTLPEEDRLYNYSKQILPNPETTEGLKYFKSHISGLLKDYPNVNYLVPWVRYMRYPRGNSYFNVTEFPREWEKEYQKTINDYSDLEDENATRSFFYLGKVMKAYQEVLVEIGRTDVKLGLGTWNWVSFPYFDKFIPDGVEFFPIDWDLNFETPYAVETLASIKEERKVYPIVWAHHDDHSYIGRPYTPPSSMLDKLKERRAEGFGILHWNTFPLDMYFKNLSAQVWQETANEDYETTIQDYAVNAVNSDSPDFNDYLRKFYTEGPLFSRETSDYFYDIYLNEVGKSLFPLYHPDSIIEGAKSRLFLLNKLKENQAPVSNTNTFNYYRCMEEFFIFFFENEKLLIESAGLCMEGTPELARDIIKKANPEEAVLKYAEAIKYGPQTIGEKAIILSLNLKWLPDFIDIKQKAGLQPMEYKFYPTHHEPLAQGVGTYTYLAEANRKITVCLGEKESNGGSVSEAYGGALILSSEAVEFSVGHWRKVPDSFYSDTWKDNRLFPGEYKLKLNINGIGGENAKGKIDVTLKSDSQEKAIHQQTYEINNATVIVPFEINHSLLHLSMKSMDKDIRISGFTIERVY